MKQCAFFKTKLKPSCTFVTVTGAVVGGVMAYQGKRWRDEGFHVGIQPSGKVLGRLAFDLGGAAVLMFGLPRFIGVPLSTLVDYFPDLGIAIIASAGAGAVGGVFRAFIKSAQ